MPTTNSTWNHILYQDSAVIGGQMYKAFYGKDDVFWILNESKDTIFKDSQLFPNFGFEDFAKDGNQDVQFYYMSNVPDVQDLVLFDENKQGFHKVKDLHEYPAPRKLGNTQLLLFLPQKWLRGHGLG